MQTGWVLFFPVAGRRGSEEEDSSYHDPIASELGIVALHETMSFLCPLSFGIMLAIILFISNLGSSVGLE